MFKRFWNIVLKHKILSVFLTVVVLGGGYYAYDKFFSGTTATQYVLATVEKGTLVASVSGSGQVSALNQLDVKANASGNVVYVGVKSGQYVSAGTLLAQLDDRDAQKAVRDAKTSLESAQLSYDQTVGSINGIRGLKEKNQENLSKAYDDGFNAVTSAFSGLPDIMTGLISILTNRDYDQIVLFSGATKIMKSADSSATDLTIGEQVTVTGSKNQDGSLTAQSIQIRPALQVNQ